MLQVDGGTDASEPHETKRAKDKRRSRGDGRMRELEGTTDDDPQIVRGRGSSEIAEASSNAGDKFPASSSQGPGPKGEQQLVSEKRRTW